MSDAAKILHDLEVPTRTVDLGRKSLARLTMSVEQTKVIQDHIARCLHSLRGTGICDRRADTRR